MKAVATDDQEPAGRESRVGARSAAIVFSLLGDEDAEHPTTFYAGVVRELERLVTFPSHGPLLVSLVEGITKMLLV